MIRRYLMLLLAAMYVYVGQARAESGYGIHDGDVGSGSVVNFVDEEGFESGNVIKAFSAYSTAKNVKGAAGELQDAIDGDGNLNIDINPWDEFTSFATELAIKYSDSKVSLMAMINRGLEKVNKYANRAAKRVDMWRRTKPTMIAYKNSASRLLDDTRDLIQDFTWAKFFDPKREWDKRREALFDANKDGSNWRGAYVNLYRSYTSYMMSFVDMDEYRYRNEYLKTRAMFVPEIEEASVQHILKPDGGFDKQNIYNYESRMVPFNSLQYSADALFTLKEIESKYLRPGKDIDTLTEQQVVISRISKWLNKRHQTMVDSRELSGYIALQRAEVKEQIARVSQIQSQLDLHYSNLFLRNKVMAESDAIMYEHTLQIMALGADNYRNYHQQR